MLESVLHPAFSFTLVSQSPKRETIKIQVKDVVFGGKEVIIMAGPCAVESEEQLMTTASAIYNAGIRVLRGGAFKPRTSPYDFQGLGLPGLKLLKEAKQRFGFVVVTEVISPNDVELVSHYADILQVGARNMYNYPLLHEIGKSSLPVLLKRGMMSTLEELFMSAEYILSEGNPQVILCERGIRTFEKFTRNTLDISAIPITKHYTSLPIVVDPSHALGHRELVGAAAKGSVAAGADGLLIEVHPYPESALCDGQQSLYIEDFKNLLNELKSIATAIGRTIS